AIEPIEHRADQTRAPLSLVQQRMWLLEEMNPGRVNYNTPSAHRLRGHLDESAFERAFREMVRRQSAMRTKIVRENGEPVQVVEPEIEIGLFPAEDLSTLPDPEREAELMRRLQRLTDTPFDLSRAPLFRVRMFRMAPEEHVLFFMPHHIIWDGWSFDLVYGELSELYRAYKNGTQPKLPALPVSYGDFAVWHTRWLEGPQLQSQLAFWRDKLAGVDEPQNLPTDKPRKAGMSGEGRTEWITVSAEQTDAMRRIAREADATLNMALLALYYVLLFETMGERNLVIGTPVRGRNQIEIESVMGCFNNLVPLYLKVEPDLSFGVLVRQVKRIVVESFEHPDVPLEYLQTELKARHGGNALLYQALFSFQDARQRIRDWGGLGHEQILLFQSGANEDLGLWFLENNAGMIGGVTFNADVFRPDTARMLRERYLELLTRAIDDPDQTISALSRISESDLQQSKQWNKHDDAGLAPARIEKLFAARAVRAPDAVAVRSANKEFTCAEVERQASRIAACLRQRAVGENGIVGLAAEQGIDRAAGMLGIWKAGAVCLSLDPADPAARLKSIVVEANVAVIIGNSKLETALDWPRSRAIWLDVDQAEIASANDSSDPPNATFDDPAVLIYPPGASGIEQARVFSHREIGRNAEALRQVLGLGNEARVLGTSAPQTAMSVIECILPLVGGGLIVAAAADEMSNGTTLVQRINAGKPDVVFAAIDIWKKMLAVDVSGLRRLKAVCFGGTPKLRLVEKILARHGELWNALSPDGGAIASCGRIESSGAIADVGRPLAGNVVSIVNEAGQLQPIGAIGEICVEGDCAGRNADSPDAEAAERLPSRTGYRGRWLADGRIEELGRMDRRRRLNGRVVDPAVIERELRKHPDVENAVVAAEEDADGAVALIAYAVRKTDTLPDATALQRALKTSLPAGANPRSIVVIDGLPLLPNGKVDHNALSRLATSPSAMQMDEPDDGAVRQNLGALERALMEIWRDLLRVHEIGIHDDFFDLGGDSLLAVRMFQRAQKLTGINLPLATLLTAPTIARQAAAYRAAGAKEPEVSTPAGSSAEPGRDPWTPLVSIQPRGSKSPLFCVHAVGGNVLNYVPLAKALDEDRPFYGIQAIGLDGLTPPIDSLVAMATRYVAEVRKIRPHGPYLLAGGSMGGMIAYEMAQQLRAAGENIALLALFDTYGPANRKLEIKQNDPLGFMGRRWRARLHRASGLDMRGKIAMVAKAVGWRLRRPGEILRIRWARMRGAALPHELRYREVERVHEQAYMAYKPEPYDDVIVLFRATKQCEGASRALGWEGVATGPIEIIDLPGGHDSLIEQPLLVENLRKVLERAQAATPG
ncbi:MAG TPA: alpha/beta fold hydrolase, partial [Rhodanobacteraceae bacterium]